MTAIITSTSYFAYFGVTFIGICAFAAFIFVVLWLVDIADDGDTAFTRGLAISVQMAMVAAIIAAVLYGIDRAGLDNNYGTSVYPIETETS